jgi:hypothetical protein
LSPEYTFAEQYFANNNGELLIATIDGGNSGDGGGGGNSTDAVDDSTTTPFNTPKVITLTANDTDPEGDTFTVTSATVPAAQGTVSNVGAVWTFTPATGFTGVATVTYTITDSKGATDTAIHTITVGAATPPPPPLTNTLSWGLLINQGGSGTLATPLNEESYNNGFYQVFGGFLEQADTYNDTVPTYNSGFGEYAFPIRAANPFSPLNIRIQKQDLNTGEWTTISAAGTATTSSFSVVSTQSWAQDKELYIVLNENTPHEYANYRAQLLDNSGFVLSTIYASLGYLGVYD